MLGFLSKAMNMKSKHRPFKILKLDFIPFYIGVSLKGINAFENRSN
jgi:hypothetical protein